MERHTEVRRWLGQEQTNKLTRYPRKEAKQSETGHHANSKQKVFMTRHLSDRSVFFGPSLPVPCLSL